MTPEACQQSLDGVGSGVAASLRAVDCMANATAQEAFGRLFGHGGALLSALTIALTLYVALFAYGLLTGRSRIGAASLTPRMMTLGLVLTFATSWVAYQSVVWNLAVGGPDEIASVLMGTQGSSTGIFADKIDVVFSALANLSGDEGAPAAQSTFSPPGLMWIGGTLLLLGTVGILATCKIALAIMLALGPVFVVMALFRGTRGLFTGWLKGVVMLALAPLFAVLGGSLMLELAVPVLRTLVQTPNKIEAQPAMAFFMIGAVHVALMTMILKVVGTMVSGWTVFGLAKAVSERADRTASSSAAVPAVPAGVAAVAAARGAPHVSVGTRQIRVAGGAPVAANDVVPADPAAVSRMRLISGGAQPATRAGLNLGISRVRGIGSRFRPAPSRSMEKFK